MPYCLADGFAQYLLCKTSTNSWYVEHAVTLSTTSSGYTTVTLFTASNTGTYYFTGQVYE